MPTTNLLHCPTHKRSWQGDGTNAVQSCPWCEIERLKIENAMLCNICEPVSMSDEEDQFYRRFDMYGRTVELGPIMEKPKENDNGS